METYQSILLVLLIVIVSIVIGGIIECALARIGHCSKGTRASALLRALLQLFINFLLVWLLSKWMGTGMDTETKMMVLSGTTLTLVLFQPGLISDIRSATRF